MTNFEREITCRINRLFAHRQVQGFAYRLKQSKCNTQYVDVLVDSLDPRYYLAIECRSISGKKIYLSQHFHSDQNNVHQVNYPQLTQGASCFIPLPSGSESTGSSARSAPASANCLILTAAFRSRS